MSTKPPASASPTEPPPTKKTKQKKEKAKYRGRPYEATDEGLIYWKPPRMAEAGHTPVKLANFNAIIIEDYVLDDGIDCPRVYKLQATLGDRVRTFDIPARQFWMMTWPGEQLGARANVYPGHDSHVRSAIIELSRKIEEHYMYRQTGWREIDGQQVYLHGAGAIGIKGAVPIETQLSTALDNYKLPDPRRQPDINRAVRASLKMLSIAPDHVTMPAYSAVWRSILGEAHFTLHIAGPSGAFKSQLAALAQQHFGPKMDADHLPLSWSSTANSIEGLCFEAKDAILVIDDYVPGTSAAEAQRLAAVAERIIRAQGNHSSRTRMMADTTIRAPKPPRGILMSTGEDIPGGQSLRARQVIVEVSRGDIDASKLTDCQADAAAGVYAMATAGFLRWIAPRMHKIEDALQKDLIEFRKTTATQIGGAHRRTPDNVCSLAAGFRMFLAFARSVKAITAPQSAALWIRACRAFQTLIDSQVEQQTNSDPSRQFLNLVAAVFTGGRAHLVEQKNGGAPANAGNFGWKRDGEVWAPQGPKIGWTRGPDVYLDATNAFAVAQQLGKDTGQWISLSLTTLQRRLKQSNLLASTDEARETVTVRRTCEGKPNCQVLHVAALTLGEGNKKAARPDNSAETAYLAQGGWSDEIDSAPDITSKPDKPLTKTSLRRSVTNKKNVGFVGFPKGAPPPPARTGKKDAAAARKRVSGSKNPPDKMSGVSGSDPAKTWPATAAALVDIYAGTGATFINMLIERARVDLPDVTDELLAEAIKHAYQLHHRKQTSVGLFLETVPEVLRVHKSERAAKQAKKDRHRAETIAVAKSDRKEWEQMQSPEREARLDVWRATIANPEFFEEIADIQKIWPELRAKSATAGPQRV